MSGKLFRQHIAEENENYIRENIFTNKPVSKKYGLSTLLEKMYNNESGKIMIFDGYTDDAIKYYSRLNKKICALNFANARNPGGGYLRGALAQEEELCRQYPTLHSTLNEAKLKYNNYPLRFGELIYSTHVARYRENAKLKYKIINCPTIYSDFITCASPNLNQRIFSEILQSEREHIFQSIDLMFKVAINNDVKILILGAWGCGAFAPTDNVAPSYTYTKFMAETFKVISQKYVKNFDAIVFAVPNDHNGIVFSEAFRNN